MKFLSLFLLVMGLCGTIASAAPVAVQTETLAGRTFAADGLYATWTGLSDTVPDRTTIDFRAQLTQAWNAKCTHRECTPVALQAKDIVLGRYPIHPTRMNVAGYVRFINQIIGQTRADVNWERARSLYDLTAKETALLRKLTGAIGGRELVAYSLTELMPSPEDGDLNVAVLGYLLRYAGREYLEALPAIHDGITSFGPYQFTALVLYDTGTERRGASVANQALRHGKIGGSVITLRGDDHYKAAWLFALDGLARLVRHSGQTERIALATLAQRKVELIKVIACTHNKPGLCLAAAWRWVKGGASGSFAITDSAAALYVRKTTTNYAALVRHLSPNPNRPEHRAVFSFFFLPLTKSVFWSIIEGQ